MVIKKKLAAPLSACSFHVHCCGRNSKEPFTFGWTVWGHTIGSPCSNTMSAWLSLVKGFLNFFISKVTLFQFVVLLHGKIMVLLTFFGAGNIEGLVLRCFFVFLFFYITAISHDLLLVSHSRYLWFREGNILRERATIRILGPITEINNTTW